MKNPNDTIGPWTYWQKDMGIDGASTRVIDNARALKKNKGWTNADLATALTDAGFESQTTSVNHMMSGQRTKASTDELLALSAALDVPVVVLLTEVCGTCGSVPGPDMHCMTCQLVGDRSDSEEFPALDLPGF